MTDTSSRRPAHDSAPRWARNSPLQTAAELSLGLSFTVAVAFGGYSAVTGHLAVVSQVAGVAFLVTLICVVVTWFRAVEHEDAPARATTARPTPASVVERPAAARPAPAVGPKPATPSFEDVATIAAFAAIAAVDAEYRR